jgi:hypothetical protein
MLKRLAILAVLLAVVCLAPTLGQTANHGRQADHEPRQQTDASEGPAKPPVAVIEKDCDSEHFKDGSDCKATGNEDRPVTVSKLPTANVSIQSNAKRDIFDWIAYAGGILLVVVGLSGVYVGVKTIKLLKDQTDAAQKTAQAALDQTKLIRDKERARIMVNILRIEKLYIGIEPGNKIMMQVENVGATQAQNVRGEFEATIVVDGFDPLNTRDDEVQDMVLHNVMRPNQPPVETYLFFFIPEEWSEDIGIVNPRITIAIRGFVRYEDIFGEPHVTPFRYKFVIPRILKWAGNDVAETHPFSHWMQDGSEGNIAT